jgi:hypothetical protein
MYPLSNRVRKAAGKPLSRTQSLSSCCKEDSSDTRFVQTSKYGMRFSAEEKVNSLMLTTYSIVTPVEVSSNVLVWSQLCSNSQMPLLLTYGRAHLVPKISCGRKY